MKDLKKENQEMYLYGNVTHTSPYFIAKVLYIG